ncbi:MAG TPA: 1-acyl-sn-glycerol-3-phosphate acyltransferase [Opitutales bacterium]|jgi:1-acyl-sn-glycerol-3-phosphate acyltransferase|nr:1-acyl-sn-glycerol-3-phosphate acyltransferase [Opitutales bacterium]
MQNIVVEEPYVPVPPRRGNLWPAAFARVLPWYLRTKYGVVDFNFQHLDRLRASLKAGHGIALMPNHSRDEDGLVMGRMSCEVGKYFYYMSSWHVFKQSRLQAFLLPRLGLYSVYREGPDRASVKTSVEILARAERPIAIFPEGFLGRTNDRLNTLMDGPALIARAAAKKRAKENPPGQVVVHPVAIRYHLRGPLDSGVANVLAEIEQRLGWTPTPNAPLRERVDKIGEELLAQQEIKYIGQRQTGTLAVRLQGLIRAVLHPLEDEWVGTRHDEESVQARVRRLRVVIVPALADGKLLEAERQRRWKQLGQIYLAQQLDNYPPDYLSGNPSPERLLETIERFQEDLTDKLQPYVPLGVTVTIGEAIPVNPGREPHGANDPLLQAVEKQLRAMLRI